MPRVRIPEGRDPGQHVWEHLATGITSSARAFSASVYANTRLSLREMEAARYRIALLNGCQACRNWRSARDNPGYVSHAGVDASRANFRGTDTVPEGFYAAVEHWRGATLFSERERLAIEFAERFATDHLSFDTAEDFWASLHRHFSDDELVDLGLSVGSWVAFGRFTRVFDIDGACRVDFEPPAAAVGM
ncbi:MAG: carboxymuconolactone decarboxylase family protein [Gammaproteobacteria bacterium]